MNNIIITTHSKRLRQLINKYFYNFNKKLHFMNCCILKLNSNNDDSNYIVKCEMIYEGILDKLEERNIKKYYNADLFNSSNIFSNTLQIPPNVSIYLIRHAQGYHNLNSGMSRYIKIAHYNTILKDPQLTQIGIAQALECGIKLKLHIKSNSKNYFFCSKFLRTRETLSNIMSILNINDKIRVLHYTHEIKDLKGNDFKDFYENKHNLCKIDSDRENQRCDRVNNIDIDWKYFDRDLEKINFNFNSNMIYEAFFIIGKLNNVNNDKIKFLKGKLTN